MNFIFNIFFFLILSFPLLAFAKGVGNFPGLPPSFFVDADQYDSHADQSADLVGHVKVIRGTDQITCDKAHINMLTNDVLAEGNVVFISPKEFIKAEKLNFNFHTQKGIVYNGFLQSGNETIEGEEIVKIGDKEYQAKNATYTSCINCPAAWKFSGSKIEATIGDYAYVTSPVIRVYGVPVLWLPYAVVPIKTERQSGLLAPSFGSGPYGFAVGESYFFALDKTKDATLYETMYANSGYKTGAEYRFVADQNSKGKFYANFINDADYAKDTRYTAPDCRYASQGCPPNTQILRNTDAQVARYSIHYEHHYELPDNYVNNINLNVVRDTTYTLDFPQEIAGGGDPALENRINLTKNSENSHLSADVDIYENLLKADPVGQNSDAVHRVPELRYSLMPFDLGGVKTSLELDYVNFFRTGSTYDEANGISGFNPTVLDSNGRFVDRFRTGQRLIVKPDFTYPFSIGDFLDVVPEFNVEEDYYQFGYGAPPTSIGSTSTPEIKPTASRSLVRGTLRTRTRLNSVFNIGDDPKNNRFKHEFIPEVTYTTVPYLYQDQHAFFLGNLVNNNAFGGTYVPQAYKDQPVTEFDALQFDYRDRLYDLNAITYGLSNVLIQKKTEGSKTNYQQLLRHRLTQSYDFHVANGPNVTPLGIQIVKQPWSDIRSLLEVKWGIFNIDSDLHYYGYDSVTAETTSVGIHDVKGNTFSLGYSETYSTKIDPNSGLVIDQVDQTTRAVAINLKAYITTKFFDVAAVTNYDYINYNFTSYLVYGLLRPPGKCWGLQMTFEKDLGSNGVTSSFSVPFFFGEGNQSVPRPPGV
jgi:LPS-assembly protein